MIVVALFIVALVAAMAYVMLARLERDTRRTSLILHDTQADFYAQGSLAWAIDLLRNNYEMKKPNQLIDKFPIKSPENEVNGYKISSTIYDMQGRFNLNNLTSEDAQTDFKRLLKIVSPKINEQEAQAIMRGVVDWISPIPSQNEFSRYYAELPEPYRASHMPMQSISELRLVKGVTPALFKALQNYIVALPKSDIGINVQTADVPVLMTLSPTLTMDGGKSIEQIRRTKPFVSTAAFFNLDVVKNHKVDTKKVVVNSGYFLVETDVSIENQHVVLYTLLERAANDKSATITILWQSKGVH